MFDLRYWLDDVEAGKTYSFQIAATNEVGESERSAALSVIAGTIPSQAISLVKMNADAA
jgi:hypothetical protein